MSVEEAIKLALKGLPVFPCAESKRPTVPGGFKAASLDPDKIRAMWSSHHGPLIGVPTGPTSGFDALDFDTDRHPEAEAWLERYKKVLPSTRVHVTRSGGLHYLFQAQPGLRNNAGKIAPGIDVRADGGYIIWWPAVGCPVLLDVDPLPWPLGMLIRLQPPKMPAKSLGHRGRQQEARRIFNRLDGFVSRSVEGERNNKLFWAACRAAESPHPAASARELIEAAVRAGLSRPEATATVRSGLKQGREGR